MKTIFFKLLLVVFSLSHSTTLVAQWNFLGLGGNHVATLRTHGDFLYAGAQNGVYRKNLGSLDTLWNAAGLQGKRIKTLLILNADTIIAGVYISGIGSDTVSLFRTIDGCSSWHPFQNGFGGGIGPGNVLALEKHPTQSGVLFGTGYAVVAKSTDCGLLWREVWGDWDRIGMGTHFIRVVENEPQIVWAGGETAVLHPYLLKSTDAGENWKEISIDAGGDNACYSVMILPSNSDVVYVGMEGRIIKTTDGGDQWTTIFAPINYPYFFGIAQNPVNHDLIYAAGAVNTPDDQPLLLYTSSDGGITWTTIAEGASGLMGVNDLLLISDKNIDRVYLGTSGEGVYEFSNPITNIEDKRGDHSPISFKLHQNYPNPFNSSTVIDFELARSSHIRLTVVDVLGREIALLANGEFSPGKYRETFNGSNLSCGAYFYKLQTTQSQVVKQMFFMPY